MGIRFWRKSPAVGSIDKQLPFEDLSDTAVLARTALLSRVCASAASDGFRVPPARDTGTGVVGLPWTGVLFCGGVVGAGAARVVVRSVVPTTGKVVDVAIGLSTGAEVTGALPPDPVPAPAPKVNV